MMKKRILSAIVALMCTLTLFAAGIAPVHAYAPPSGEGDAVIQAEQFCWCYRTNHGVEEMRLWSLTYGEWVGDWMPVPDGWFD